MSSQKTERCKLHYFWVHVHWLPLLRRMSRGSTYTWDWKFVCKGTNVLDVFGGGHCSLQCSSSEDRCSHTHDQQGGFRYHHCECRRKYPVASLIVQGSVIQFAFISFLLAALCSLTGIFGITCVGLSGSEFPFRYWGEVKHSATSVRFLADD